ncbi:hypothetical protein [Paenibacillus sp. GCM10012306]|uniref:hypothetical protein n=1 Tax=Paenibacillus sp. GCM10012306 TaxID=3317342 RepID=UPI003612F870
MKQTSSKIEEDKKLKWWQLSLLGIAGTIGIIAVIALSDWIVQHFRAKKDGSVKEHAVDGQTNEYRSLKGGAEFRIKSIRSRKNKV